MWDNAGRKAGFQTLDVPDTNLPAGQLKLMTLRSHDQYNTTVYDLDDRYRGIKNARKVVFCHADDLAERGLSDGDAVDLASHFEDGVERLAPGFRVVAYDIPARVLRRLLPRAERAGEPQVGRDPVQHAGVEAGAGDDHCEIGLVEA